MRNIENINTKGNANVKSDANSGTRGEKIFEAANADVIRDESRWDAFQLMGDTNREEMTHVANAPNNRKKKEYDDRYRERFVDNHLKALGGKVTAVMNFELR